MKRQRNFIAALTLVLSGCGGIAYPPQPSTQSTSSAQNSQATASGNVTRVQRTSESDAAFVAASAVVVGPGDTVYALSRRHRVPVQQIIRRNNLQPPFLLRVGQRIEFPRGRQHRVSQGDTLYSIANSYDIGVYELARLNALKPPYTIKIGELIVIPESAPAPQPVAPRPKPQSASAPKPQATAEAKPPESKPVPPSKPKARVTESIAKGQGISVVPPRKPKAPVPPPPARAGKGFVWPVKGRIVSRFGVKQGGLRNDGINIRAKQGTPVRAAENGVVAYAGNEIRGFGNLLLIKHSGGYITAYAHNDRLLVKRGQRVERGQKISTVGRTGSVTEPQLHFEIRKGRRPRNPQTYLGRTG